MAVAFAFAMPALGAFGSNPSKECSNKDWNREYWKAGIGKSFEIADIETSSNVAADEVSLSIDGNGEATWQLSASSEYAIFRIFEKGGTYSEVNAGLWVPGDGGTFTVEQSISHITFCFTDIPEPKISIEKKTNGADPTTSDPNFIPVDDPVTWTYEVRNEGNVPLLDVVVTDSDSAVTPVFQSGDDGDGVLEHGETWVYSAGGVAEAGTYQDGFVGYSNIAAVTAQSTFDAGSTGMAQDSDSSGYYGSDPSIHIEVFGPDDPVIVGSSFDWLFEVTNDGNVPLGAVVVTEDGTQVGNCSWAVLLPGVTVQCTLTEIATPGEETSTFVASGTFDDGESQTVVSETLVGVEYDVNNAPVAVDDDYTTDERDLSGVMTLVVPASEGVLSNDSDPDGDPLTASDATTPTNGGSVTLSPDGSFSYTPSGSYVWGADELSRVDTFDYTVEDGKGGSDVGTVSINVVRKLCVDDSISSPAEQNVTATFTLTSFTGCKDWPVLDVETSESSVDGTVLFQPPLQGDDGEYVGELTVFGVAVDFSDLDEVILKYDPTGGEVYELVPGCDGDESSPALPDGAETGWCFYDIEFDLNAGLWDVTWHVYGIDDPKFSFK